MLIQMASRYPGNTFKNLTSGKALRGVRKFISIYSNPELNWEDIKKLRDWTSLPIILKGILDPNDAAKATEIGMDGIIVSNHGGRQVDGSVSSVEMLEEIRSREEGKLKILVDSGIRSGSDIFKCLALGADGVLIGRPYVYALALDGQNGVKTYLSNLIAELQLTMALSGCKSIEDINKGRLKIRKG